MIALDKQGKIKAELLFQMLELHKITLNNKDKVHLKKTCGNGDQIKYKDAIALLCIDMELAETDELKWTVTKPTQ